MFTKKFLQDLGERCVATFLQAFVGALVITDAKHTAQAAAIAGLAAVLALVKGVAAQKIGDPTSASTVPTV